MTSRITTVDHIQSDFRKSAISPTFTEIEQIVHDARAYSLGTEMNISDIYELVRQTASVMSLQEMIPVIIAAIVSRKDVYDLQTKNNRLHAEILQLGHNMQSMKQEINLSNIHEWILEVSVDGTIMEVNDFMVEHSGFSREELIGKNMRIMSSGMHSKKFWNNFWTTILSGRIWAGDVCNKKKDGSFTWLWTFVMPKSNENGEVVGFKVIRQNISESEVLKKKLEEALDQKVDFLTELPNHAKYFEDFPTWENHSLAILHINSMFDINSVFGRKQWDIIIKEIAKILRNFSFKKKVHVYKFEGVDFGIVFEEEVSKEYIKKQFRRLNDFIMTDENDKRIPVSFSLWIAFRESDIHTLLQHWYLALKESKQAKKVVVYDKKNHTTKETESFFKIQNLVKEAFKEDLFEMHFQEIRANSWINKENRLKKFECLVRMYDSKEKVNLISPGSFLPVIKKDGNSPALTACVIEKVCIFMRNNEGVFSVNLTEEDLSIEDFSRIVYEKTQEYNIAPERMIFEILEEIENVDSGNVMDNIRTLKKLGFALAIDDFGSGYSNFARMLEFEPNYLKINMSFVRWIDKNPRHRSIVKGIVGIAHDNGMMVIGEGVETENEQLVLESLGVDYSQGYLFSKPSPTI